MKVRVKGWFLYVCKYIQMVQIKLIKVLYNEFARLFYVQFETYDHVNLDVTTAGWGLQNVYLTVRSLGRAQ